MISQMGIYPKNSDRSYRRTGISRFRTAARAVLAIQRMNFLVNKSRRVSIAGSRESTSRSRVVNGDLSSHTVYQAPAGDYALRSSRDITQTVPSLDLYQNGVSLYPERYSPRSDRRTYQMYNTGVKGDMDSKHHRHDKSATTAAVDQFSRRKFDDPLPHRSHPVTSSRSPRNHSSTSWSDSRSSSTPRAREPMTSDYAQVMKSPPVRDTASTRHDYSDRDRFVSTPRHSSPNRRERSGSPVRVYDDDIINRPLSPSGASSVGSVHNGSDIADHSLNLYIHRLESLQDRLGAINRGKNTTLLFHPILSILPNRKKRKSLTKFHG